MVCSGRSGQFRSMTRKDDQQQRVVRGTQAHSVRSPHCCAAFKTRTDLLNGRRLLELDRPRSASRFNARPDPTRTSRLWTNG